MNVIAVDDEKLLLDDLTDELGLISEISNVASFLYEEDALEYVKNHKIDVAFLDIKMRSMGGIELAKRIIELQPKVNIIFLTAYADYGFDAMKIHASGYILKPATTDAICAELAHLRYSNEVESYGKRIRVTTFGNFDLYIDDKPVLFRRQKSKEILAALVDKKGGTLTRKELACYVFEDKEYNRSIQTQMQVFISDLLNDLTKYNASNIIIRGNNCFAINKELIDCDYYDFLSGNRKAIEKYNGVYMENYYWAEETCAELTQKKEELMA